MRAADNVMVEVSPDRYESASGFVASREQGMTPAGNPIGGRWVLRNKDGTYVDVNQYRHDLFEHHDLKTAY